MFGKESQPYAAPHNVFLRLNEEKAVQELGFLMQYKDGSKRILQKSQSACLGFNFLVYDLVFDSMFSPIKEVLSQMPARKDLWEKHNNDSGLAIFSLSPSPIISQITEHIISLLQHLQPFSNNKACTAFLERATMNVLEKGAPERFGREVAAMATEISGEFFDHFEAVENAEPLPEAVEEGTTNEDFAMQWITSICRATVLLFVQKIGEIARVSPMGIKQLIADIGEGHHLLRSLFISSLIN